MSKEANLENRVKNAGLDLEFVRQVNRLEELKALVAEGKMKLDVYQKLEDAVFKAKKTAEPVKKPKTGLMKTMMTKMMKSPTDKLRDDGNPLKKTASRTRIKSERSRGDSYKSNVSTSSTKSNRKLNAPEVVVVEGKVLKFVRKKNKRDWRDVYAVLYPDRLDFKANKEGKALKSIELNEDFYVSVINGGHVERAERAPSQDSDDSDFNLNDDLATSVAKTSEIQMMQHVFVIASISHKTKIYLACENEEKREFWVTMCVEVLRDLMQRAKELEEGGDPRKGSRKIWEDVQSKASKFVQAKIGRKLNATSDLEELDGEELDRNLQRWQSQGNNVAKKEIVEEWRSKEKRNVNDIKKENENLQKRLKDKSRELVEFKVKTEQEMNDLMEESKKKIEAEKKKNVELNQKYDELMEKYREEAYARNQERKSEEERIKKRIKALQRRSMMPHSEEAEFYREELEKFKAKLEILQKALKIDLAEMDWDGTLEQAEQKMQECLKNILEGETPEIQMKAQQDFDKWDQLVRGHQDYIAREENKWKDWEADNLDKNIEALNEMRDKFVPEVFRQGCSVKDLMEIKGIPKKTAERIWKNKIFKFLWMEKDTIARLHAAALNNDFASQGLDLRELRAIYACLPDEFNNDNDGKKKMFRENMRARLYTLTEKQKKGDLSSQEELNNAYRDKDVAAHNVPKDLPKLERKKGPANNKLKNKAAALEAFFNKQNGNSGPPKAAPAASNANNSSASKPAAGNKADDPLDPAKWEKYVKMQKMNLPDGAIVQKIVQDGKDPALWDKFKKQAASGGAASESEKPKKSNELDPDAPEYKLYFKMHKMGLEVGAIKNKMVQNELDPGLWEKLLAAKQGPAEPNVAEKAAPAKMKKEDLNPDDAIWGEYFKMKRVGLGLGQIMNKMQQDGRDPTLWATLVELKDKQSGPASSELPESLSPFDFGQERENVKQSSTKTSSGDENTAKTEGTTTEEDMKRALKKLNKRASKPNAAVDENGDPVKKKKKKKRSEKNSVVIERSDSIIGDKINGKKKTRRQTRRQGSKDEFHLLQGDTKDLIKRAMIDVDLDMTKTRGSHHIGVMDYNDNINKGKRGSLHKNGASRRKTLRQSRVGTTALQEETPLQQVIDVIMTDGVYDEVEGGVRSMKFGEVFDRFIEISDILVGLLLKGKKTGQLKYKGDMLFKGIHDEIKITVL